MPLLQRQLRRLDVALRRIVELKRKRATLLRLTEDKLSQLQDQYDWFLKAEERLAAIEEGVANREAQIEELKLRPE